MANDVTPKEALMAAILYVNWCLQDENRKNGDFY